ncbi:hypothetical protein AV530_016945 [Patagioenas fasciata monilis]|uniref:Uncharacterized protein n=1 Tax=Patagioenas fasciata monilis TaxID=372326 RepID=A0A1V4J462_PATFA|nr:hypothetical protein AV530_016945 [Patagioenas fasciata monilis]
MRRNKSAEMCGVSPRGPVLFLPTCEDGSHTPEHLKRHWMPVFRRLNRGQGRLGRVKFSVDICPVVMKNEEWDKSSRRTKTGLTEKRKVSMLQAG